MDRAPGMSVRLKLTLSYAGFLMLAGALMLAVVWVSLLRYIPDGAIFGIPWLRPSRTDPLRGFTRRPPSCWPSCWCSVCWEGGFSPAACSPP